MNPDQTPFPTTPRIPLPLRKQSRPAKKQMITVLRAADFCLSTATDQENVKMAIEALAKLCDDDLQHAKTWLGGMEPIQAKIDMANVDKLLALIDSVERVRPRLQAAVAAAKVRGALEGMAKDVQPEDVAKLKAQTEN